MRTSVTLTLLSLLLAGPSVHAMSKCEAQFATDIRTSRPASEARPSRRASETAAALAKRLAKVPIVDLNRRQDLDLEGQPSSPHVKELKHLFVAKNEWLIDERTATHDIFRPVGDGVVYEGQKYIEFPNSTTFTTRGRDGRVRTWVITRGIRPYKVMINRETGAIEPIGYVSDMLLSEVIDDVAHFHSVFVKSDPAKKIFIEDPRAADEEVDVTGQPKSLFTRAAVETWLYFTHYASHKTLKDNPDKDPDVMNMRFKITSNEDGVPEKPVVSPKTGVPKATEALSPKPVKIADGHMENGQWIPPRFREVDAKNGMETSNIFGQSVVLARFRPNQEDGFIQQLFNDKVPTYAIQSYRFASRALKKAYDWRNALMDWAGKPNAEPRVGSVAPVAVDEIIRDSDMKEYQKVPSKLTDVVSIAEGEKGTGGGPPVLHTVRVGDFLLGSTTPFGEKYVIDVLQSGAESDKFPIPSINDLDKPVTDPENVNAVAPLWFPHNIRKLKVKTPTGTHKIRHYSVDAMIFNPELSKAIAYLPDVAKPDSALSKGRWSGILDLMHKYWMGFALAPKRSADHLKAIDPAMMRLMLEKYQAAKTPAEIRAYEQWKAGVMKQYGQALYKATGGESDAHTPWNQVGIKGIIVDAFARVAGLRSETPW